MKIGDEVTSLKTSNVKIGRSHLFRRDIDFLHTSSHFHRNNKAKFLRSEQKLVDHLRILCLHLILGYGQTKFQVNKPLM